MNRLGRQPRNLRHPQRRRLANEGCGEGSEKETAEQGPKGSVLCFDAFGDNDEELW